MATKKAASTAKKTPAKKKPTTTKKTTVTTVKAVESKPVAAKKPATKQMKIASTPLLAAIIAEFIGTFLFAAIIVAGQGQPLVALFGLAGVVLTVGAISGAYVNPALVIGSWVTKRISGIRAAGYIVAQVLGAMLALVVLNAFANAAPAATDAAAMFAQTPTLFTAAAIPEGHAWVLFATELIGTMIFGFAVANALSEKKERTAAALTVGLGIFIALMIAGSAAVFVGGSAILNPAVAIALQAINFSTVWPTVVYILGSTLGAVLGFALYNYLQAANKEA